LGAFIQRRILKKENIFTNIKSEISAINSCYINNFALKETFTEIQFKSFKSKRGNIFQSCTNISINSSILHDCEDLMKSIQEESSKKLIGPVFVFFGVFGIFGVLLFVRLLVLAFFICQKNWRK
jgi:hypothetical protein